MSTFKIKNITNLLNKRDSRFNMLLDIEYVDERTKKIKTIKAGETVFLTVQSLPLSVHRLRIKNMVEVSEVSAAELAKLMENDKPKSTPVAKPQAKKTVPVEDKEKTNSNHSKKTTSNIKKKSTEE